MDGQTVVHASCVNWASWSAKSWRSTHRLPQHEISRDFLGISLNQGQLRETFVPWKPRRRKEKLKENLLRQCSSSCPRGPNSGVYLWAQPFSVVLGSEFSASLMLRSAVKFVCQTIEPKSRKEAPKCAPRIRFYLAGTIAWQWFRKSHFAASVRLPCSWNVSSCRHSPMLSVSCSLQTREPGACVEPCIFLLRSSR